MKKASILITVMAVFTLGFVLGCHRVSTVHAAQAIQPAATLQCNVVGPCSQYIVQVNSGRGYGRFQIYPVTDVAIVTNPAAPYAGNPSLSVQFSEPDPRGSQGQTFTLAVSEP